MGNYICLQLVGRKTFLLLNSSKVPLFFPASGEGDDNTLADTNNSLHICTTESLFNC